MALTSVSLTYLQCGFLRNCSTSLSDSLTTGLSICSENQPERAWRRGRLDCTLLDQERGAHPGSELWNIQLCLKPQQTPACGPGIHRVKKTCSLRANESLLPGPGTRCPGPSISYVLWNEYLHPSNSHVETLIPNVIVLGGGPLGGN